MVAAKDWMVRKKKKLVRSLHERSAPGYEDIDEIKSKDRIDKDDGIVVLITGLIPLSR